MNHPRFMFGLVLLVACNPSPEDTGPEALEAALSGSVTTDVRRST